MVCSHLWSTTFSHHKDWVIAGLLRVGLEHCPRPQYYYTSVNFMKGKILDVQY